MGRSLRKRCQSLFSGDYRDPFNIGEVYIKSILSQRGNSKHQLIIPKAALWLPTDQHPSHLIYICNWYLGPCGGATRWRQCLWQPRKSKQNLGTGFFTWTAAGTSPGSVQSSWMHPKAQRLLPRDSVFISFHLSSLDVGFNLWKECRLRYALILLKTSPSTIIITSEL